LIGTLFLSALNSAFRRLQKRESKKQLQALGSRFFYRRIHHYFFPHHEYEGLFFSVICAQNITRFCYAACSVIVLIAMGLLPVFDAPDGEWTGFILGILILFLVLFFFGEFFPRIFGTRYGEKALQICAPPASLFMLLAFPLSYFLLRFFQSLSHVVYFDYLHEPQTKIKQEIMEIVQQADSSVVLEPLDRKIIESVMDFRNRIAREVMVPRIELFSLACQTTIKEAAQLLEKEGYSRVPVYKGTIDNIIGVLMYKDILLKYMEYERNHNDPQILQIPIETIMKNVLYTPETKKISHLLQEFRKKQVHLAIVVDEYGGTEGIVTIEDILEEIVGEIADEYDQEAAPFTRQPDGSWVVDARLSILDVEEQLGLKIPQEGDYDTVGGYIYHRAGTIPTKGFIIDHDEFKIEVMKSSERSVEEVRITPKTLMENKENIGS
jgi:CBS domain containing-hemolysin-like protein